MVFNKILRPSVGARFIAPTADLSALGACDDVVSVVARFIAPWGGGRHPACIHEFVNVHHCACYQDRAFTRNVYIRG